MCTFVFISSLSFYLEMQTLLLSVRLTDWFAESVDQDQTIIKALETLVWHLSREPMKERNKLFEKNQQ